MENKEIKLLKTKVENLKMLKKTYKEMLKKGSKSENVGLVKNEIGKLRSEIRSDIHHMTSEPTQVVTDKKFDIMEGVDEELEIMRRNLYKVSFDEFDVKPFAVRDLSYSPGGKKVFASIFNHLVNEGDMNVTFSYVLEREIGKGCGNIVLERLNKQLEVISKEVFTNVVLDGSYEDSYSYRDDDICIVHAIFTYDEHKFVSIGDDEAASEEGQGQCE